MHTKIICTIGPASISEDILTSLIRSGMNIARLNFSYKDLDFHKTAIRRIRSLSKKLGKQVDLMADLEGSKIRVVKTSNLPLKIEHGDIVKFTKHSDGKIDGKAIVFDDRWQTIHLKIGSSIYIDDGKMQFIVQKITDHVYICMAHDDGEIYPYKGVHIPYSDAKAIITDSDKKDLDFINKMPFDWINLSFVENAKNISDLRKLVAGKVKIVAKIEREPAIKNLSEIIKVSDAVMVARGDLGLEIPIEQLPIAQKTIIMKCNHAKRFVITATQMLDSMTHDPRPTRAEVTDVANAILDGSSAVMLSNETAVGKYPVQSLQMMQKIAHTTEQYLYKKVMIL